MRFIVHLGHNLRQIGFGARVVLPQIVGGGYAIERPGVERLLARRFPIDAVEFGEGFLGISGREFVEYLPWAGVNCPNHSSDDLRNAWVRFVHGFPFQVPFGVSKMLQRRGRFVAPSRPDGCAGFQGHRRRNKKSFGPRFVLAAASRSSASAPPPPAFSTRELGGVPSY